MTSRKEIPARKRMTLPGRIASFRYAFRGLAVLLREPNARIHAVATVLVVLAGLWQQLDADRWLWLTAAIAGVWITEALNTAIEQLCDLWCEGRYHPVIGRIKDVAAGAVLLAAAFACITGFFVFIF